MTTAMTNASRTITITDLDDVFVGQGIVTETGQIVDIAARLGETAEETERIYDAIEDEIQRGRSCGVTDGYAWEVNDPLDDAVAASERVVIRWESAAWSGLTIADYYGTSNGWVLRSQIADPAVTRSVRASLHAGRGRGRSDETRWQVVAGVRAVELMVIDQPWPHNETSIYLSAAIQRGITLPDGVTLDAGSQVLAGDDPDSLWSAFVSLRAAVASVGHGQDLESRPIPGRPTLVAHQGRPEYPVKGPHDIR